MRHQRRYQQYSTLAELNVTPLLDLAFVLLIIFMITAPLLGEKAELTLPSTQASRDAVNPADVHVITLDRDAVLYLDGQQVPPAVLTMRLATLRAESPHKGIVIEADKGLNIQQVVDVMDDVSAAGIDRIAVITRPHDEREE